MDAAVAALIGAGIGTAGTVLVAWLQARNQAKRDLVRAAVDVALAEYGHKVALARERGGSVVGVSVFISHHAAVLRSISDGKYTAQRASELDEALTAHIRETHQRTASAAAR